MKKIYNINQSISNAQISKHKKFGKIISCVVLHQNNVWSPSNYGNFKLLCYNDISNRFSLIKKKYLSNIQYCGEYLFRSKILVLLVSWRHSFKIDIYSDLEKNHVVLILSRFIYRLDCKYCLTTTEPCNRYLDNRPCPPLGN